MPSGYSGTPLIKKLGLKENYKILLYNQPDHYFNLFRSFPESILQLKQLKSKSADFIHLFCQNKSQLIEIGEAYKTALKYTGSLWVSWPKGSSKIETDLKRESVRDFMLSIGLVDTKVCAIDKDWSGLKFMYRTKDRK